MVLHLEKGRRRKLRDVLYDLLSKLRLSVDAKCHSLFVFGVETRQMIEEK